MSFWTWDWDYSYASAMARRCEPGRKVEVYLRPSPGGLRVDFDFLLSASWETGHVNLGCETDLAAARRLAEKHAPWLWKALSCSPFEPDGHRTSIKMRAVNGKTDQDVEAEVPGFAVSGYFNHEAGGWNIAVTIAADGRSIQVFKHEFEAAEKAQAWAESTLARMPAFWEAIFGSLPEEE